MDPDTAPVGPPASGTPCILAGRPRSPAGHRLRPAHGATVMPKDAPASPPNVLRGAAARACPCPPSLPRPHGSDLHGRGEDTASPAPQLHSSAWPAGPCWQIQPRGASPSRCSLPHPSSSSASPPSPPGSCVSPSRLPSAVLLRFRGFVVFAPPVCLRNPLPSDTGNQSAHGLDAASGYSVRLAILPPVAGVNKHALYYESSSREDMTDWSPGDRQHRATAWESRASPDRTEAAADGSHAQGLFGWPSGKAPRKEEPHVEETAAFEGGPRFREQKPPHLALLRISTKENLFNCRRVLLLEENANSKPLQSSSLFLSPARDGNSRPPEHLFCKLNLWISSGCIKTSFSQGR